MRYIGKAAECVRWLMGQAEERGGETLFEARVWKSKRSLAQNAYYWALLNRLTLALGVPSGELHMHMLRSYGPCDVFTVRDDVPLGDYFRYYDIVGEGRSQGRRYVHIRAFKGSSEMDSGEFAKLLDGVIQECRQQGIETLTPAEIAALEWIGA